METAVLTHPIKVSPVLRWAPTSSAPSPEVGHVSSCMIMWTPALRHYVEKHFQGRLVNICRGGFASRPYERVATNHVFVGAVGTIAAPTNRFIGAVWEHQPPLRFVGAATVPTTPTNHFSAKKN